MSRTFDKIDASTLAGFQLRLEREYGFSVYLNKTFVNAYSARWWEVSPIAGLADLEGEAIYFAYNPEQNPDPILLCYALAHEAGHLLECRDQGLDLYTFRKQVELYEIEDEAWERGDEIFFAYNSRVTIKQGRQMVDFRKLCLDSYKKLVESAKHRRYVKKILKEQTV